MIIITNRPSNSRVHNEIIRVLDSLTGLKWGYVSGKHKVQYVSSQAWPIKIGILWGKPYEKNIKYKLDLQVHNKFPSHAPSIEVWIESLTAELQSGLLELVADDQIKERINSWTPSGDYALLLIESREQNKRHPRANEICERSRYDPWMDSAIASSCECE
jgi:ubiquitin-protein ligase